MNIEKNIPMPNKRSDRISYDIKSMEVGDSFYVEGQDCAENNSAYMASQRFSKKTGRKFTGKKMEGGVRIWRIA